ncbi:MAG: hypothetical protein R3246_16600, partial [Acidimicrobiia bacterium]|nr:hypothetical protein [Acidimicrobiia bacterium]
VIDADNGATHRADLADARVVTGLHVADDVIHVWATRREGGAFRVSMSIEGDEAPTITPIAVDPTSVAVFDGGLVVGTHSTGPDYQAIVSTDLGLTWEVIDRPVHYVVSIGGQPVMSIPGASSPLPGFGSFAVVEPGPPARLSDIVLPPVEAESGDLAGTWAGGLDVWSRRDGVIRYLPSVNASWVDIPIDPEHGFDGVLRTLIPGSRLAIAGEGGRTVLYRWIGR